ncbi:MAG: hypothetical protein Q3977_07680 [Oscillospiraceae bacterium]|nr:hypothetical protein [Oscillospiraceae bacterium]
MTKHAVHRLFQIIFVLGIFVVLGTMGASDLEQISLTRAMLQSGIGLLMAYGGAYFGGLIA